MRYGLVVIDGFEYEIKEAHAIAVHKLPGTGRLEGAGEPFCRLQEWLIVYKQIRSAEPIGVDFCCSCEYIVVRFYTTLNSSSADRGATCMQESRPKPNAAK